MEKGHSARKNTHGGHAERRGPETVGRDSASNTSVPAQPSFVATGQELWEGRAPALSKGAAAPWIQMEVANGM